MKLMKALNNLASGLSAQRTRLDVASSNLANARTTRTDTGGPYQRRLVTFAEENATGGVVVDGVINDTAAPRMVYDPGHPDAGPDGMVAFPDISVVEEMVDMISASRAYEAGVTAMNGAVGMAEQALMIGKS